MCFSVKIKRSLRDEFKRRVVESGLSTCFITETLLAAWIEGNKVSRADKVNSSRTITVNQNFTRVVKRSRRGSSGFRDSFSEGEPNFYDGKINMWEYRPGPANLNGHAAGCACSQCRR